MIFHPRNIMGKIRVMHAHLLSDGPIKWRTVFALLCYCQMEVVSFTDKNYKPYCDTLYVTWPDSRKRADNEITRPARLSTAREHFFFAEHWTYQYLFNLLAFIYCVFHSLSRCPPFSHLRIDVPIVIIMHAINSFDTNIAPCQSIPVSILRKSPLYILYHGDI